MVYLRSYVLQNGGESDYNEDRELPAAMAATSTNIARLEQRILENRCITLRANANETCSLNGVQLVYE